MLFTHRGKRLPSWRIALALCAAAYLLLAVPFALRGFTSRKFEPQYANAYAVDLACLIAALGVVVLTRFIVASAIVGVALWLIKYRPNAGSRRSRLFIYVLCFVVTAIWVGSFYVWLRVLNPPYPHGESVCIYDGCVEIAAFFDRPFLQGANHVANYLNPKLLEAPLWGSLRIEVLADMIFAPGCSFGGSGSLVPILRRGLPAVYSPRAPQGGQYRLTEIPFDLPVALVWWIAVWKRIEWSRSRRLGFCTSCRYDLTGNVSGVCPECGTACDNLAK